MSARRACLYTCFFAEAAMNLRLAIALFGLLLSLPMPSAAAERPRISWKRSVIDAKFRSEGVAVADVNKDGKPDILVGDVWYEAPAWKVHRIRPSKDDYRKGNDNVYSNTFACWADDLNGDGWPDLIVIGFPGAPCHWYENPQGRDELWKQHVICKSACNETPQYVELFAKGKRVLVMGYDEKQMVWVAPGQDPTQPWEVHVIGGDGKKAVPGTARFAHGLGVGDVNGDGRADVLCTGGWWEQPAQRSAEPWKFHPANLGPNCADMYAVDVDGDGKPDVISSSAHDYGMWVHLQRPGKDEPAFVLHPLFGPPPEMVRSVPKCSDEEEALYLAVNKARIEQKKAPLVGSGELFRMARDHAERLAQSGAKEVNVAGKYGKVIAVASAEGAAGAAALAKVLLAELDKSGLAPGYEIGVGCTKTPAGKLRCTLIVGDRGAFSLPSQTHALNYVDIDGDGIKDLVTGRRYWAHGPKGDASPGDPAYLYWFKGKRDAKGILSFTPHEIDDDSGIGTQFTIADMNGDGIPDIVISNKRGVFLLEQLRAAESRRD
jgi:hypothetical protein